MTSQPEIKATYYSMFDRDSVENEKWNSLSYNTDPAAADILQKLRSINCYMVQKSPVEVLTLREEEIQTLARQDYERHIAEKLVKACGNADLPHL
ncbi:hypothetical protein ETB97_005626 [Aspergillus alliaceus]|uniref:Uncharacterized protein n=1 Tax=Petromyces alliaceus TaxID=209559 RepID=A0A8H5ZYU4_PETAA|nr:hypothetical protein ETB97_005626 [Aspergillus burnettii]